MIITSVTSGALPADRLLLVYALIDLVIAVTVAVFNKCSAGPADVLYIFLIFKTLSDAASIIE